MTAKTPCERQRASREARKASGGEALHAILSRAAAAKLRAHAARTGETKTAVVNRLLERSKLAP